MTPETPRPLSAWRFDGTLRAYQADALARVDVDAGSPVHLVAPPGSGKTLLGLLLAARRGRRTVVFAPTTAIRAQWVDAARGLASSDAAVSDAAVSDDPSAPADLTALTYQAISVQDATSPFAALAHRRWETQLEADDRTPEAAAEWLRALAESNPAAYRRGIRSRSRSIRRSLAREDADVLASALHPNARALLDRLVEAGVETVVLDECHHLLDHWALVVAALLARIRAGGREPLVVGLTATLPSPDDADEYDNYVSLLGEVDLEVPVPAVVREGDLAPYRDLVHVVEPTPEEQLFLSAHAEALQVSLRTTFAGDPAAPSCSTCSSRPSLRRPRPIRSPRPRRAPSPMRSIAASRPRSRTISPPPRPRRPCFRSSLPTTR
ncbi:DEAD/DEAH box helicase [Microbacterium sp. BH-3-3-3]|uniref:DEAD/DEAH box helicase n=1 Tax=Microbacterium sp. BH-3-3-3 TaxID=1906742 RepID=UPI0009F261EC|nr:DEAD/DEAH box helicase [Microbacterium sp. BH-3-3-3]